MNSSTRIKSSTFANCQDDISSVLLNVLMTFHWNLFIHFNQITIENLLMFQILIRYQDRQIWENNTRKDVGNIFITDILCICSRHIIMLLQVGFQVYVNLHLANKCEDLHWAEERCISQCGFDHFKYTFYSYSLINIQKGIKIFVILPSHVIISIFRVSIQSTGEASNHQKNRLDTYQLTGILNDRPKYTSINSLG